MTPRKRLLTTLSGKIPDCVPVAPDFSNMIPARLTGKPFWDLYLYNDPPIHEAYIAAAKHFNIDSVMDGYFRVSFPEDRRVEPWLAMPARPWETFIVHRDADKIVTQMSYVEGSKRVWWPKVAAYYRDNPPTWDLHCETAGLPPVPTRFEPLEGVKPVDHGPAGLRRVKQLLGDQGLVGVGVVGTCPIDREEHVFYIHDHPEMIDTWAAQRAEEAEKRFHRIMALPADCRPDFLCVGGSGTLIFQTVETFRRLSFPAVKRVIELADAAGMPTHIHSCGPEKALVKIMAEETRLTVIDPLEIPPMGDCVLADLKRLYGTKLTLKGNLHTTEVMLRGTPDDVVRASKKAIDDAAEGGRFILSTGDQCGRDTPDENLRAMVATARDYGKYS